MGVAFVYVTLGRGRGCVGMGVTSDVTLGCGRGCVGDGRDF